MSFAALAFGSCQRRTARAGGVIMERRAVARAQRAPVHGDSVHRAASRQRKSADVRSAIGNQSVQRLLSSPCLQAARDQDPVEEFGVEALSTPVVQDKCLECQSGLSDCPRCAGDDPVPLQAGPPPPPTYTFIRRGSYGQTLPNFTAPSCAAAAPPAVTSTMVAGTAAPTITVFPTGTYSVRRNDGVLQTATCTRLAAGLAATQAHENSHANGARNAVSAANTAAGLPRTFPTAAACSAALPGVLATWNASVVAGWTNERNHGPGTNPPTAQTFTQEHAAGTCTFV